MKCPPDCCAAPCACSTARQIIGQKSWLGFAGGFAFPGFKANWVYATWSDAGAYDPSSGSWTFAVSSLQLDSTTFTYACTGSTSAFNPGDLVLQEWPAAGPMTDYLTGLTQRYPKYYRVFICTAAVAGSTISPFLDTAHFEAWDFLTWDPSNPGAEGADGAPDVGGPSGWPMSPVNAVAQRAIFSQTTNTAQFEVTTTTVLNNFPLFPATMTNLIALMGATNDSCNSFSDMTVQECAASGTLVYDWTFANRYDETTPTYTAPGTAPSTEQAPLIFPNVPSRLTIGWGPTYTYVGATVTIDSLFFISGNQGHQLVTWSFSSTSIVFEFAAWDWNSAVEYEAIPFKEGPLASAPATVTQTITLGGDSYLWSDVSADAQALMEATNFSDQPCNSSRTNTWNTDGTGNSGATVGTIGGLGPWSGCTVGTPITGAIAFNKCPATPDMALLTQYMARAQVTPCAGTACLRTYNCPTVTCHTFTADGTTGYVLDPNAASGTLLAVKNIAALTPGEAAAVNQSISGSTGSCSCT
jgi:hypothetical protein